MHQCISKKNESDATRDFDCNFWYNLKRKNADEYKKLFYKKYLLKKVSAIFMNNTG